MEDGLVTVIITVWKRGYLEQQFESLLKQSLSPAHIWVLHNESYINIQPVIAKFRTFFSNIYVIHSDFNLKYFGRFSICSQVETEYVLIIDDDVIPSPCWINICISKCNQYNAVISCSGRIIPKHNFRPEEWKDDERKTYFIGDNYNEEESNYLPQDTLVDYGCNSYFFKTAWLCYFWSLWPCTFLSGEDIHLSASLMILKSIPTLVPRQISGETSGNLKKYYSQDKFSSWRDSNFINIREMIFKYLIKEKKWQPILWK